MKSPAYLNHLLYTFFCELVWRHGQKIQKQQYKAIRSWIPPDASIAEICAGTGTLTRRICSEHLGNYKAFDINKSFVKYMQRDGIDAELFDLRTDPIPRADVLIMVCALYHFKNNLKESISKLISGTSIRLIIIESLSRPLNLNSFRDRLRARFADIGEGAIFDRIDKSELLQVCNECGHIEHHGFINNIDYLVVMNSVKKS
ncbi:MAG TPA: class I SAM-dependent methyltransferase [Chitinispirillaceae bacterium]|nr:class I SAM-dependent methyltransferase [Chitinispirillaceae bacterium]